MKFLPDTHPAALDGERVATSAAGGPRHRCRPECPAAVQRRQHPGSRDQEQAAQAEFRWDAPVLRRGLLDQGYAELPVFGNHALAIGALPPIHRDPCDRMLVAQAMAEDIMLLTADPMLACYPGPVRLV